MDLDMFQTMALGIVALFVGGWMNERVAFLKRVCIPGPVTGGLIISSLVLVVHFMADINITYDGTLQDICMMIFFTTAGLQCNFKLIKKGGKPLLVLILLTGVMIICQNCLGIGLSFLMGQDAVFGLASGSITMTGGHGTAGGFCTLLEEKGLTCASSMSMAAATFGLLAGSLMGGPIGRMLIEKNKLKPLKDEDLQIERTGRRKYGFDDNALLSMCVIFMSAGLGSILRNLLLDIGISVPLYFGSLIVAILIRNVSESITECPKLNMNGIVSIGEISLSLFLGMALASLRLWELAGIALPLLIILVGQAILMFVFARFAVFRFLGGDYDAAVLTGGFCGFGLGATPNALANMDAICRRFGYSPIPFILIPLVGAAFSDILNISIVTLIFNLI